MNFNEKFKCPNCNNTHFESFEVDLKWDEYEEKEITCDCSAVFKASIVVSIDADVDIELIENPKDIPFDANDVSTWKNGENENQLAFFN